MITYDTLKLHVFEFVGVLWLLYVACLNFHIMLFLQSNTTRISPSSSSVGSTFERRRMVT